MHEDGFVTPGEILGRSEEIIPGLGTYEEDGTVYASLCGAFRVDKKTMAGTVRPPKPPVILQRGDIVIGKITIQNSNTDLKIIDNVMHHTNM